MLNKKIKKKPNTNLPSLGRRLGKAVELVSRLFPTSKEVKKDLPSIFQVIPTLKQLYKLITRQKKHTKKIPTIACKNFKSVL